MTTNKVLGSVATALLTLMQPAISAEDPWTHFIGSYNCQVDNEVNVTKVRQTPQLQIYPARQQSLAFSIDVPLLKMDRDSCAHDAENFARMIKAGGGIAAFAAKQSMEQECDARLELVISAFSVRPSEAGQHYTFTDEFLDDLDRQSDGGMSFHGGNLGNILHIAGDWHFTFSELTGDGGLIWYSGQCARDWRK